MSAPAHGECEQVFQRATQSRIRANQRRVLSRLSFALALACACHHDAPAPKLEPGETQPLPPSSGTPIGYLVDAAGDLKLTDDQVGKLKDLDDALAARLESIDSQLRGNEKPVGGDAPPPQQGRRGGRRGGMGTGGGGMSGGSRPHRNRGGQGSGSGSGGPSPHAGDVARLSNQRSAEVKDALTRAFAILDDTQQTAAKKLLADHDVDVETGSAPPPPSPAASDGEPGEP